MQAQCLIGSRASECWSIRLFIESAHLKLGAWFYPHPVSLSWQAADCCGPDPEVNVKWASLGLLTSRDSARCERKPRCWMGCHPCQEAAAPDMRVGCGKVAGGKFVAICLARHDEAHPLRLF